MANNKEENRRPSEDDVYIDNVDNVVLGDGTEDSQQIDTELVKKLRESLKKCTEEKHGYLDGWQRARADLINARKRDEEEKINFLKFAKEEIILQLLTVIDSFDMAFSNTDAWEKTPKEWRAGIEYIYTQLLSIMTSNGVKQLNPLNESFDPKRHVSIETIPVAQKENDGIILSVLQKGYELNGKNIREAKVRVGEYIS